MVGPAAPLQDQITPLADSCWLLRGRLSGGAELTYRGGPPAGLADSIPGWCGGDRADVEEPPAASLSSFRPALAVQ